MDVPVRRGLGRERFKALIRVIDIETTGIDLAASEIIEIASVDMVRGGGITNPMDTLASAASQADPARRFRRSSHRR